MAEQFTFEQELFLDALKQWVGYQELGQVINASCVLCILKNYLAGSEEQVAFSHISLTIEDTLQAFVLFSQAAMLDSAGGIKKITMGWTLADYVAVCKEAFTHYP
ncbi:MAG: hypothetical protein O3C23_01385 [bacterium]|nr:hypothetical protein [bacterium]